MSEVTRENHNLNDDRSTPPRAVNNNDVDDLAEIDLVGLVTAVLRRCRSIYRQAAENYNAVLRNRLLGIPGHLMGFSEAPLD